MGSRLEHRVREARFWELLRQGLGRTAACDAVGVDRSQTSVTSSNSGLS